MKEKPTYQELEEKAAFFQTFADNFYDWEMFFDLAGEIKYISPSCELISGYSANEFIENPKLLTQIVHQSDKEIVCNHFDRKLKHTAKTVSLAYRIITKNGNIKWIEYNCHRTLDKSKRFIGYSSSNRDITERKKTEYELYLSEEKFRSFVKQASEGIYLFELKKPVSVNMPIEEQVKNIYEGQIIEANDSQAKMYGFQKAEEIYGMSLAELHGGTDNPDNIGFLRSWIEANYRIIDAESSEIDKNGNNIWFSNNVIGYVEDGYLLRLWGTQIDITERKYAEQIQKILYNISNSANTTNNLVDFATQIKEQLGTIIDTTNFYIALYDENTDMFSIPNLADEKEDLTTFSAGKSFTNYH